MISLSTTLISAILFFDNVRFDDEGYNLRRYFPMCSPLSLDVLFTNFVLFPHTFLLISSTDMCFHFLLLSPCLIYFIKPSSSHYFKYFFLLFFSSMYSFRSVTFFLVLCAFPPFLSFEYLFATFLSIFRSFFFINLFFFRNFGCLQFSMISSPHLHFIIFSQSSFYFKFGVFSLAFTHCSTSIEELFTVHFMVYFIFLNTTYYVILKWIAKMPHAVCSNSTSEFWTKIVRIEIFLP